MVTPPRLLRCKCYTKTNQGISSQNGYSLPLSICPCNSMPNHIRRFNGKRQDAYEESEISSPTLVATIVMIIYPFF
jgi:hypothetical protein